MSKIPVSENVRKKIIEWLNKKIKYEDIIKLVEKEGESITKGGITYIKYSEFSKKSKQTKQKNVPEENESESSTGDLQEENEEKKPDLKTALELHKENIKTELYETNRVLTDFEFKMFKKNFEVIYNSNLIRLQKANAKGILNALDNCKDTIQVIEQRGNYT